MTPAIGVGLSCYSANILAYLERYRDDAAAHVARSVRLALRSCDGGLLAFSHHGVPLHELGRGRKLAYRGAPDVDAALEGVIAEVAAHGQALVVANAGRLPWVGGPEAPHFLLVDGHGGQGRHRPWHVVDRFTALADDGPRRPFEGRVDTATFAGALVPPHPMSAQHRLRNEHAFGFPVPVPAELPYLWLAQVDAASGELCPQLPGAWVIGTAAALERLGEDLSGDLCAVRHAEDLWAAARHQLFRHIHPATAGANSAAAAAAWQALPMTLRFARDSARRGRPRPTLVSAAIDRLRLIESETDR